MNMKNNENNLFLYWIGKEYKLIKILRNLIYLHSTNGNGYKVHLINHENIKNYLDNIPEYFYKLCPAHQADYVRVCVILKYGGIWMDSDTLVLDSLDSLFDFVNNKNGFFIRENNKIICNGIFGSKSNSDLLKEWKNKMEIILNIKKELIGWTEIGNNLLQGIFDQNKKLFDGYEIFNGSDNMYPINWNNCVKEYLKKPYDNYKIIIRPFQPLIVLVNSVYKELENKSVKEIFEGNLPLNYFISKSFENMNHLIDLDFIEIGTSNFDTLIEKASNYEFGISVEPIKYYIDQLPNKINVKKINCGISNINSNMDVYYISEENIIKYKLNEWFKGCNSIGKLHPLHIKHKLENLVTKESVKIITAYELFYMNNVKKVKYLKIDTEGHDCIILNSLYDYIEYLPNDFKPNEILFETNEHSNKIDVDNIINKFSSIGYKLKKSGYDTLIVLNE
jgi:hypothetical protein